MLVRNIVAAVLVSGSCAGLSLAQTHAIVGNYGEGSINMIDLASQTVVRTFPTAGNAEGVAFSSDGSTIYFSGAGHVMAFNAETGAQLGDLSLGTSLGMSVPHPNGQVLYVGFGTDHAVKVLDLATFQFTQTINMPTNTIYMAMSTGGGTLYAASSNWLTNQSFVSVVDTASNTVVQTITMPYKTAENALSPNGTILLCSSESDNKLLRLDLPTGSVTGEINMPGGPRTVRFSPDGATAYVANAYVGKIVVVDMASFTATGEWNVGGMPFSLALSDDGATAYVSDYMSNSVRRVDVASGEISGTIPVGRRPYAMQMRPSAPTCAADFNSDNFLDFFDYDDYVNCFESGSCPSGKTADFNGDNFVDFFDYDDFVSAFESGC